VVAEIISDENARILHYGGGVAAGGRLVTVIDWLLDSDP